MRKKVVVFGGGGFLGSYLVEHLLQKKHDVICADIKPSGYLPEDVFSFCDISQSDQVNAAAMGADVIFNLAGVAGLDEAIDDPVRTVQLNVLGNLNILEAARQFHIDRMVYASSAYAMSEKGSFYGISKLTSEKLVEEYYKKYGVEFTIIRYGSIYGDRDYNNNYIYNVVKEAMQTSQINHSGDGEEIREYIHAMDVALLAEKAAFSEDYINEHIILTGMERIARKELFFMIKEMLGDKVDINFNNNGYQNHYKTTPYSFQPTMSKKVVPNPFIDLGQGILRCMQDIQKDL